MCGKEGESAHGKLALCFRVRVAGSVVEWIWHGEEIIEHVHSTAISRLISVHKRTCDITHLRMKH